MSCSWVGGSQILVIGGYLHGPSLTNNEGGIAIFDMGHLTWAEQYTANGTSYYEQSDLVRRVYTDPQK